MSPSDVERTRLSDPIDYSRSFFAGQQEGSRNSALLVLPFIFHVLQPRSVVDVGCGVGTWLSAVMSLGCDDVLGIDGAHVPSDLLQVPRERFLEYDLRMPIRPQRVFDLALCLEVGEHLPEECAPTIVESLTRLAPAVLFSAAIPHQGGAHHVNEQWPQYWAGLFARWGYVAFDYIRPRIWNDERIEWWYRQNMLLFASEDHRHSLPTHWQSTDQPLSLVHPDLYLARTRSLSTSRLRRWARRFRALLR